MVMIVRGSGIMRRGQASTRTHAAPRGSLPALSRPVVAMLHIALPVQYPSALGAGTIM